MDHNNQKLDESASNTKHHFFLIEVLIFKQKL